jgi:hypothetical protein
LIGILGRDAFPKDKVNDAQALVEKGMGLKRNGKMRPSEWWPEGRGASQSRRSGTEDVMVIAMAGRSGRRKRGWRRARGIR